MTTKKFKDPFEFWSFRDVRNEKFSPPKIVEVPLESSNIQKKVTILLSHHYLIPRSETPKVILDYFRDSLIINNPDFIDYQKYGKGFVLKYINPFIRMYVSDSKYLGLPRSIKFEEVKRVFNNQNVEVELKDIRPDFEDIQLNKKQDFTPLYYQKEAIDKIINENIVLRFLCGRGKTSLTLLAINEIQLRTLILVRTRLLIKQWIEEIHKIFDINDNEIGIITSGKKTEGKITVATVQSIINLSREEKQRLSCTYGHVVCDECHEAAASQYFKLLQIFKCRKITGLTATPFRKDGKSRILASYIGTITKVDDSGIIPVKFDFVKTEFDFKHDGRKNEYTQMIDNLIIDEKRNNLILEKIKQYTDLGRVAFVYSSRIKHLEDLQQQLKEKWPELKSGLIVNKTSDGKRLTVKQQEDIRQAANNLEIQVVFGTQIIKQGFNVKPLFACIVATPSKSNILIEQILGRSQREFKDKKEVVYVDFIDEKIKTLLYQFFYKNQKVFKRYREMSHDSRKAMEIKKINND